MEHHQSEASDDSSDDELLDRVRAGDTRAFGALWQRHAGPALSVARSFVGLEAEDIVSEAFTRLLAAVQDGKGPRAGFRPYLIATVRNVGRRQYNRSIPGSDVEFDQLIDASAQNGEDEAIRDLDATAAGEAFQSLQPRWQQALWYSEVDGLKPREMSGPLGLPANAVSALVLRAKRGFRDAWVSAQLARTSDPECIPVVADMGAYTRGGLSARARSRVDAHVATCAACTASLKEAKAIAQTLSLVILPAVAGTAGAAGYLATLRPPAMPEMQLPVTTAASSADGIVEEPASSSRRNRRVILVLAIALLVAGGAVAGVLTLTAQSTGGGVVALTPGEEQDAEGEILLSTPEVSPSPVSTAATDAPVERVDGPSNPPGRELRPPAARSETRSEATVPRVPAGPPALSPPSAPTAQVTQPDGRLYPRLTGDSALPGARIDVFASDGSVLATTTADARGQWQVRVTDGAPGENTVTVRQTLLGRASDAAPAMTYSVELPPSPTSPDSGAAVNATRFNFKMSAAPGAVIQRDIRRQTPVQTLQIPASGVWNEYLSVAPGEHVLRLRYFDPVSGDFGPWSETVLVAR